MVSRVLLCRALPGLTWVKGVPPTTTPLLRLSLFMKTQNRPDNLKTYRGQEAKITKRYRLAIKPWPVFKVHPLPDKQRQLLLNYCQSLSGVNKGSVHWCRPIFPSRKKKTLKSRFLSEIFRFSNIGNYFFFFFGSKTPFNQTQHIHGYIHPDCRSHSAHAQLVCNLWHKQMGFMKIETTVLHLQD